MMPTFVRRATLIACALVLLSACHQKKAGDASSAPTPVNTPRDSVNRDPLERERSARERAERERMDRERALAELRRTLTAPIHFGFDRSDLTPEAREQLEAKARILSANASIRILVEGNADELGSDEYNLALGQRRATVAKRYLTDRSIAAERIEVSSFGEERPTCAERTEECRARNRRDEVRITAGEPTITQR